MTQAALGFRAHSGWAAVVAVAGPRGALGARAVPAVIDRRRIELVEPGMPWQPYHAAEKLELKEAEELVKRCIDGARGLARRAIRAVTEDLRKSGHEVVGCGVLLASGRPLPTLAATLASHALIHTAEGELFREALVHASQKHNLPVTGVREKELFARAAADLRLPVEELQGRIAELGRVLGPPWRQDQKYAALVAWLALAARPAV